MTPSLDIVISGAGAVGLTVAALLAQLREPLRPRITVIDAGEPPAFSLEDDVALRVSALSAGSIALLAGLGVDERIAVRACPYRDMRVWDARHDVDAPQALRFRAADMALPQLGFIVEDALLRYALYDSLQSSDVILRSGAPITDIERDTGRMRLTLDNGAEVEADLLVGADGANSFVRRTLGIDMERWSYPQSAVVTHVRPARPHRDTAWQRFLPTGPLALLPLADGRVSIVWSTSTQEAGDLLETDDAEFAARLTEASDRVLGMLEPSAPRAAFPLRAQHARRYVQRGVALVGDAAHTVHPLAGQGANLGFADAAVLVEVIGEALAAREHIADLPVLRRYERERRGANAAMLYFTDGLNRLFSSGNDLLGALRGTGMRVFNLSGPLKRGAMRVALGLDAGAARGPGAHSR